MKIIYNLGNKTVLYLICNRISELSEAQYYAYWYAPFFPGTHVFRLAGVPPMHVFLVGTR